MFRLHPLTLCAIAFAAVLCFFFAQHLGSLKTAGLNQSLENAALQGDNSAVNILLANGAQLEDSKNDDSLRGRREFFEPNSLLFNIAASGHAETVNTLLTSFPDRNWQDQLAISRLALASKEYALFDTLMANSWPFEQPAIESWLLTATDAQLTHHLPQLLANETAATKTSITAAISKAAAQADLPRLQQLKQLTPASFAEYSSGACCVQRSSRIPGTSRFGSQIPEIFWPMNLQPDIAHAAAMHPEGLAVLKWLKKINWALDAADSTGKTPLMWAALGKRPINFDWLVANGSNMQRRDANGQNILMFSLTPHFSINWPSQPAPINNWQYTSSQRPTSTRPRVLDEFGNRQPQLIGEKFQLTHTSQYRRLLDMGIDPTAVDNNGASAFDFDFNEYKNVKTARTTLRSEWIRDNRSR